MSFQVSAIKLPRYATMKSRSVFAIFVVELKMLKTRKTIANTRIRAIIAHTIAKSHKTTRKFSPKSFKFPFAKRVRNAASTHTRVEISVASVCSYVRTKQDGISKCWSEKSVLAQQTPITRFIASEKP